jgi:hypothetical protein
VRATLRLTALAAVFSCNAIYCASAKKRAQSDWTVHQTDADELRVDVAHEFNAKSSLQFDTIAKSQAESPKPSPVSEEEQSLRQERRQLLENVRKSVLATIDRLPKYICTETVDRSVFPATDEDRKRPCPELVERLEKDSAKTRPSEADRLRLDVAIAPESEMYSWVGENRFRERRLSDWVSGGAISTGAFGTFLASIFKGSAAIFGDEGDRVRDGRTLAQFSFRIPVERSRYNIGTRSYSTIVGYEGTFLVDPQTFDLVWLTVRVNHLPAQLHACQAATTLDYSKAKFDQLAFLLPTNAQLQVINDDGTRSENQAVFSACHQFQAESKLSFGNAEPQESSRGAQPIHLEPLPSGLHFKFSLTTPIETKTAAAGDLITARLDSPIKGEHGAVLVSKGAKITGRIVRFERFYAASAKSLLVGLKLETIERNSVAQPLRARFADMVEGRASRPGHPGGLLVRQDFGTFDRMSGREDPALSLLQFEDVTRDYVVHRGLTFDGTTLPDQPQ